MITVPRDSSLFWISARIPLPLTRKSLPIYKQVSLSETSDSQHFLQKNPEMSEKLKGKHGFLVKSGVRRSTMPKTSILTKPPRGSGISDGYVMMLLIELDASFNKLTYLPTNIGFELVNLKEFSIQYNKIRSLPTSIGGMKSLKLLDVYFIELRSLQHSVGKLINLEILNLSSNFSDLTELPENISDLISLKELHLSNNQIHTLPFTFGRRY